MGNKALKHSFIALLLCLKVYSQGIPIQLMLVDINGFEKINNDVKIRLSLRTDSSSINGQYQEVHITRSNEYGIISIILGEGIPTSNSKVMGLEGFNFSVNEPFIKTELDTSLSPSNYYSLGWMKYSYPIVARRALQADTADYLRNYLPNHDNDSVNELQNLMAGNGYLYLSQTNDTVPILNKFSPDYHDFCYQSDRLFYSDSIDGICKRNDSVFILSDSEMIIEYNGNSTSFTINQQNINEFHIRKNRILFESNDNLSIYDFNGLFIANHLLNNSNKLLTISDSTIILTNNTYGVTFTITFINFYTGTSSSSYKNVCFGCVSRALPSTGVSSGDTAWISGGSYTFMCYQGNLYESGTSNYKERSNYQSIITPDAHFKINPQGILTITNGLGSKATNLNYNSFYPIEERVSLELKNNTVLCRYFLIDGWQDVLFNRYMIEPLGRSNIVEVYFSLTGEILEIKRLFVDELIVHPKSNSSYVRISANNCANGVFNKNIISF